MIPSLHYLDRFRNEGTRTYSTHSDYSEARPQYRPDAHSSAFPLLAYTLPRRELLLYTANPPDDLFSLYCGADTALFCIHPQVVEELADDPYVREVRRHSRGCHRIPVVPSSSTRTLYAVNEVPHALKVHFPFRVSRYSRKMRSEVIEQAINVSRELEEGIEHFDRRFAFLREVVGIAYPNLTRSSSRAENWGFLIRDMHPFPRTGEKRPLVPGFALYGRDFFHPTQPPLLFELIGDRDPVAFILQQIMLPILRHWVDGYTRFGYMLEPHGQNVLLELDRHNTITRIVHRDLSVGIDMRQREAMGLSSAHLNDYNRMDSGEFSSITYDMFMGSHFFDRIIQCCQERYTRLTAEDFREPCRQLFAELFPGHSYFMPATVHYFSEQRDRFGKPLYQDTGRKPVWRPAQR